MVGFNRVILIGNLTRHPELRYTQSGTPVAKFGLAVSRRFRQEEEQKEEVCFVDIVVFGKQAEHCGQYLSKGNGAVIEGRLNLRQWETEDGQRRSKHEVVAQSVTFLPKRPSQNAESDQGGAENDYPESHSYDAGEYA